MTDLTTVTKDLSGTRRWRAAKVQALIAIAPSLLGCTHIGTSHICAVHGLPVEKQLDLLWTADRERWTRRALESIARGLRPKARRGRPRRDELQKMIIEAQLIITKAAALLKVQPTRVTYDEAQALSLERLLSNAQSLLSDAMVVVNAHSDAWRISLVRRSFTGEKTRARSPRDCQPADWGASRREAVLNHLLQGRRNKEIAQLLNCSPRTVEDHVTIIMRTFGVRTRYQLRRTLASPEATENEKPRAGRVACTNHPHADTRR